MIESIIKSGQPVMKGLAYIFEKNSYLAEFYTSISRWVFVFFAIFIMLRAILSLLLSKNPSEIWAYLALPGGRNVPLRHWENVLGRATSSDVHINIMTVSRNHGTLVRDSYGNWYYNDLGSKGGSFINGKKVLGNAILKMGDSLRLGSADCFLVPASLEEKEDNKYRRLLLSGTFSPWTSLIVLTIFQIMAVIQFIAARGAEVPVTVPLAFAMLTATMWIYCISMSALHRRAFEIEIIAFFLCTLGLSVSATAAPTEIIKQVFTMIMGVILFFAMCWYLRDLERTLGIRRFLVIFSILLLAANIFLGTNQYGQTNWIHIGGMSVQPSEFVKIAFIFIGAATLDELFQKVNLGLFLGFSAICLGSLALMGDFGTAAIFFVTFLVISFMRSGDVSKLFLVIGAAGLGGLMVLRFKPYIMGRFASWGHAWEFSDIGSGYQQTRTMTAASSGGLLGLGPGEGMLHKVAAAKTDLVFGILCEEWGLIIGVLAILSIVTLGIFAVRSIKSGRSSYYTIAACATTTLFIFQTILNVFGSVDLLPLTGVTFPFVSSGGSSMIASWGLLSFLKAADTRQNASFAVKNQDMEDEVI